MDIFEMPLILPDLSLDFYLPIPLGQNVNFSVSVIHIQDSHYTESCWSVTDIMHHFAQQS